MPKTLEELGITTAGDYAFTATYTKGGVPTTTTAVLRIGDISKLQYADGGTWRDITKTLFVLKGTSMTFKAALTPPATQFPAEKPVWGGAATGQGNQTVSVSFNSIGNNSITAECGNTVTAGIVVYDITPVTTPIDNFTGRSTTKFGIGEVVGLSVTTDPIIAEYDAGGFEWGVDDNIHKIIVDANTGNVSLSVGDAVVAGNITLSVKVVDGPSKGLIKTLIRSIVLPTGATMLKVPGTALKHTKDYWEVGFLGIYYLLPADVSFSNFVPAYPLHPLNAQAVWPSDVYALKRCGAWV